MTVLFVAAPDPAGPNFPREHAPTFAPLSAAALGVPGIVVGSDDDPYCAAAVSRSLTSAWGFDWVGIGSAGHINASSGLDSWPEG